MEHHAWSGGTSSASKNQENQNNRKGKGKQSRQAYALTTTTTSKELHGGTSVVDGTTLISHWWTHVLFDIGVTHSFISLLFASVLHLDVHTHKTPLTLSTPIMAWLKYLWFASLFALS